MQYFRNAPRRTSGGDSCTSDFFPLCRYDKTPQEAEATVPKAGCGCTKSASMPTYETSMSSCGCKESRSSNNNTGSSSVSSCGCVKTPTAEDFGCTGLAMAFIPEQEFSDLNEPDEALCRGSLFQKLDMPFYGQKRRNCK